VITERATAFVVDLCEFFHMERKWKMAKRRQMERDHRVIGQVLRLVELAQLTWRNQPLLSALDALELATLGEVQWTLPDLPSPPIILPSGSI
jgi:hypothetical protein